MYFNLKHLDFGNGKLTDTRFKLKNYEIQAVPEWPKAIHFFANAHLDTLQIDNCLSRDIELWATIIGKNPIDACKLKVLNLSHNQIGISGAKILAPALEFNQSIEVLDLSDNNL